MRGKNSTDESRVSCDCDLSDSSTVEISAQLDLLAENLGKMSVRATNSAEPLLHHTFTGVT